MLKAECNRRAYFNDAGAKRALRPAGGHTTACTRTTARRCGLTTGRGDQN
jgi:hypothetical protein